jgi:hypothetical protein
MTDPASFPSEVLDRRAVAEDCASEAGPSVGGHLGRGRPRTQRARLRSAVLWLAALGSGVAGCDPIYYGSPGGDPSGFSGDGRVSISWTLNGTPFSEMRCKNERIDSMNVLFVSEIDGTSHVEFTSVACGLDKYSVTQVPTGPLRVYVDAVRGSGATECVRYSGRISLTASTQFPSSPTPVPLRLANTCP